MSQLPNKREILQPILDAIELGWTIKKPSPLNPTDIEHLCIFQHAKSRREVEIAFDNSLFQDVGRKAELERLVRHAIRNAKPSASPAK